MTTTAATFTEHRPMRTETGWAIECTWNCGNLVNTKRKPPTTLGCDRPECHAKHNAHASAPRVRHPRTQRVEQQATPLYNDWAVVGMFIRGGK